jgi:transposase
MTIREIAEANGVSVQSIYKKLKSRKINVATLKKDNTGQLTESGEKQILELLKAAPADSIGFKPDVEKLKTEVERLKTQVEMLTSERDYLRTALEHEQALHGLALQRIALPSSEHSTGFSTRLKRWFKKGSGADANEGK